MTYWNIYLLIGSWADNELSPECLDGAAGLLRPDGISIPKAYTSYAAPITSPRLWSAAKAVSSSGTHQQENNLETLWVVYMQNKYDIAGTKVTILFLRLIMRNDRSKCFNSVVFKRREINILD